MFRGFDKNFNDHNEKSIQIAYGTWLSSKKDSSKFFRFVSIWLCD